MREEEKAEIRNLALFRNISDACFDSLMQASYAQEFPPHLQLIWQGRNADFLHVVLEGAVELHAEWNGRDTTMAIVRPVTSFILAACIQDSPYLMSARTLSPSRIVLIPAADLRLAFRSDAGFAVDMIDELATGYRRMVRYIKNLKLRNSRQRLAAYLLTLLRQAEGGSGFVLPHEKRLLASYLGMTPESLSRAFKDLSDYGVHINGARVTVTDARALAEIAMSDPLMD